MSLEGSRERDSSIEVGDAREANINDLAESGCESAVEMYYETGGTEEAVCEHIEHLVLDMEFSGLDGLFASDAHVHPFTIRGLNRINELQNIVLESHGEDGERILISRCETVMHFLSKYVLPVFERMGRVTEAEWKERIDNAYKFRTDLELWQDGLLKECPKPDGYIKDVSDNWGG